MQAQRLQKARRDARKAAERFADQEWPDVERIFLDQVTSWSDPQGYTVWAVDRKGHDTFQYVRVENATLRASDWS